MQVIPTTYTIVEYCEQMKANQIIVKGRGNIYSSQMRRWRNGYKPFA